MHSLRIRQASLLAGVLSVSLTACQAEKDTLKGAIDEAPPPAGSPVAGPGGKADDAARLVAVDVQSPHPYANDVDRTWRVELDGLLPSCASEVRLHFAALRTEAGYDFVEVTDGERLYSYDGNHDDTWTGWLRLDPADPHVSVRLISDYSITRHGFEIDAVEWAGEVICPQVVWPPCGEGTVDVAPAPGACDCPPQPVCVGLGDVEVQHNIFRGFNNTGKRTVGAQGFTLAPGPADGLEPTLVGQVDSAALTELVRDAARAGLLQSLGYSEYGEWTEIFSIRAGDAEVYFTAPRGDHSPEIADLIARFEALFSCADGGRPMACGQGYACVDDTCTEEAADCFCTEQYDPVCGVDGRTYGNACKAGCADMPVAHDDECGITGDMCGGFAGFACSDGYKCRYDESTFEAPHPDAAGTCVSETYCDAALDCAGLLHPAVPGAWACEANQCSWKIGSIWQTVQGWTFETAHPYGNDQSVWKQLYLPEGASAMHLTMTGVFDLEPGYDVLDVWTWKNGAWQRVKRYTGAVGPSASDVFEGRYHYLHFASDYSITGEGFSLGAQYR
jgi:hypothetical protein